MQQTQNNKSSHIDEKNQLINENMNENIQQIEQQLQQLTYIVTFHHPKLITKTLMIRSTSYLSQYRSLLSDGTLLKLFENYQFVYNKQILPEMTQIKQLFPPPESLLSSSSPQSQLIIKVTIQIKLVQYDERTAKHHLKQVFQMINNPILYQLCLSFKQQSKQLYEQLQQRTNNLQSSILINQNVKLNSNINQVLDFNLNNDLLLPHYKIKKPQLIQFISLSGFNPPPPPQRLDGNFFIFIYVYYNQQTIIQLHVHKDSSQIKVKSVCLIHCQYLINQLMRVYLI